MKKLHPQEADLPTYQFRVQNTLGVSSSKVMFRVHHILRNGIGPFHYFCSQRYLSNGLLNHPSIDNMQTIHTQQFDVPT